jgi:fatty-acyl-CoA synthase
MLDYWSGRFPERDAIVFEGTAISWAQLAARAERVGAGLAEQGVGHGEVVGILMRNRPEFLISMLGAMKIGAIVGLLNVRATASEMAQYVADSRTRLIITEGALVELLSESVPGPQQTAVVSTEPVDGCLDWCDVAGSDASLPSRPVGRHDGALLCYTSGTTGLAKGAVLTHGNIWTAGVAAAIARGTNSDDRMIMPLPLAFTGGTSTFLREGLIPGVTTVLEREVDAGRLLEVIESHRITFWSSVPVVLEMVLNHPRFSGTDISSLRHVTAAGASVSLDLLQRWNERGVRLAQGYGLTETAGGYSTLLFADEAERKLGSAGRPLPQVSVRVADPDGRVLGPGEAGEIQVSGPTILKEYWSNPAATAEAVRDGWLYTGDMGVWDEEGYLTIVDRKKDMLISGGLNVYPAELERVLSTVLGEYEFTVIGVPHERWGEVPMVVVPDISRVDIQALKLVAKRDLSDYKRPRYLAQTGAPLPRTLGGKVLKRELRALFQKVPPDAIDLKA